jgi:hypothetical protein
MDQKGMELQDESMKVHRNVVLKKGVKDEHLLSTWIAKQLNSQKLRVQW